MANEEQSLKELEQQIIDRAHGRQEKLTEEVERIRLELAEMLSLSVPIAVGDSLKDEIQDLAKLVGQGIRKPSTKTKEEYSGKNISTEQKATFVQQVLEHGPLSKKEMLDSAEIKFDRSVAPTFLDTAIGECLEDELIEETGEKKGRSIIYALVS